MTHELSGPDRHARRAHSPPSQLLRRRESGTPQKGKAERAVLQLINPLEQMVTHFTEEERCAGRRLVRFSRTQDGNKLCVGCEPIKQDDYEDHMIVVSCILRTRGGPCITSVDIIALLQHLVQDQFSVEEKNRIRRNLEGFRPATISKMKADTEDLFRQIMEFADPKPRNIEKDVKVFDWSVLGPALEKIVNKYVWSYGPCAPLGTSSLTYGWSLVSLYRPKAQRCTSDN